jgi:prophage regulatory protein
MKTDELIKPRLVRLPEVPARTGLSRSTLYVRIATNQFPRPVNLGIGRGAVAWLERRGYWLDQ